MSINEYSKRQYVSNYLQIISKTQCKNFCYFLTAENFSSMISVQLSIYATEEPILMYFLSYICYKRVLFLV